MRSVVAFLLTLCVKNRGRDVGDEGAGRGGGMGRGGERVGVAFSGVRLPMITCEEHLLASTDTCFMTMFATCHRMLINEFLGRECNARYRLCPRRVCVCVYGVPSFCLACLT